MSVHSWIILLLSTVWMNSLLAETITIRADYWYPMNGDPNSEKPGYMIELAKAIFEPNGIAVDYQLMPWPRAIQQVRLGHHDCVVGAYKESVPDFTFAHDHWGMDQTLFYKLKGDTWEYTGNLDDLIGRKVGVIRAYSYGAELDKVFKSLNAQSASGDNAIETNIKKMFSGRIDTLIESYYVMQTKLSELNLTKRIVSAGDSQQGQPMYLACSPESKRSKRFIRIVNEAMPKLKNNGQLKRILNKYDIQVW